MQSQSPIFRLPREVRDMIHGYCLTSKDGLRFNPDTRTLTFADGSRNRFAWMHTCKLAAAETREFPVLRYNVVHFSTHCTTKGDSRLYRQQTDRGGGERQYFSAAQVALSFMVALPSQTRTHLRNLVLHEDRKITHHPERDGKRLIPFCQENASLRIEQRVSLWSNIWLASSDWYNEDDDFILPTLSVTKQELAPWIMEDVSLPSLGMPQDACTLVLDGNPRPDLASEIFAVAQQDASWQTAFERSNAWLSSSHEEARRSASYIMDGFPKAIQNIVDGTSLVKCNFRPLPNYGPDGSPNPHIDQSPYINPQWSLFQYTTHWYFHNVKEFEVRTRKPDWLDIRRVAWE